MMDRCVHPDLSFIPPAFLAVRFGYLRLRLPTGWRGALCLFFEPLGRPGPGLAVFGALAGVPAAARAQRNAARTRPGVISPAGTAGCQGRRAAAARGGAGP